MNTASTQCLHRSHPLVAKIPDSCKCQKQALGARRGPEVLPGSAVGGSSRMVDVIAPPR